MTYGIARRVVDTGDADRAGGRVGQQGTSDRRPEQRTGGEVGTELLEGDGGFDDAATGPPALARYEHAEDAHVGQRVRGDRIRRSGFAIPTSASVKCC